MALAIHASHGSLSTVCDCVPSKTVALAFAAHTVQGVVHPIEDPAYMRRQSVEVSDTTVN